MTSSAATVGIMMPADMGAAMARMLTARGSRTVTCLEGRSERTRLLSSRAGVEDLGSDSVLVRSCDIVLSIVSPDAAMPLAQRMARAIGDVGKATLYVDCNAIAPHTSRTIADVIVAAGGRFVDAGIIGLPPRQHPSEARVYAAGPEAEMLATMLAGGLDVRVVSDRIGDASAVKMCYAALTKGSFALMTQLIVAAHRLGVAGVLQNEVAASQHEQFARLKSQVPAAVPKAFRWVAEMEEIALTFESVGVSGLGFKGAAETYSTVAGSALGKMRVEEWQNAGLSFEEVVAQLAAQAGDA